MPEGQQHVSQVGGPACPRAVMVSLTVAKLSGHGCLFLPLPLAGEGRGEGLCPRAPRERQPLTRRFAATSPASVPLAEEVKKTSSCARHLAQSRVSLASPTQRPGTHGRVSFGSTCSG